MVLGVIVSIAVVGVIVTAIAMVVRGGRGGGLDWTPRTLVRVYLYIASLAGIVVLVIGLSGILNAGFAAAFGDSFVYGDSGIVGPQPACAPASEPNVKCPPVQADFAQQRARENARRRGDDLIRGITFTVFGLLFWGAHWFARRGLIGTDDSASGLRRGYLMLGTVMFGLTTIILFPTGVYQALSYLILPAANGVYRQGVGDSLAGGLVTFPIWLIYLWLVVRDLRAAPAAIA